MEEFRKLNYLCNISWVSHGAMGHSLRSTPHTAPISGLAVSADIFPCLSPTSGLSSGWNKSLACPPRLPPLSAHSSPLVLFEFVSLLLCLPVLLLVPCFSLLLECEPDHDALGLDALQCLPISPPPGWRAVRWPSVILSPWLGSRPLTSDSPRPLLQRLDGPNHRRPFPDFTWSIYLAPLGCKPF